MDPVCRRLQQPPELHKRSGRASANLAAWTGPTRGRRVGGHTRATTPCTLLDNQSCRVVGAQLSVRCLPARCHGRLGGDGVVLRINWWNRRASERMSLARRDTEAIRRARLPCRRTHNHAAGEWRKGQRSRPTGHRRKGLWKEGGTRDETGAEGCWWPVLSLTRSVLAVMPATTSPACRHRCHPMVPLPNRQRPLYSVRIPLDWARQAGSGLVARETAVAGVRQTNITC